MGSKKKDLSRRFWSKVEIDESDKCWLWHADLTWNGYGLFWFEGTMVPAHRIAWRLSHDNVEIPSGMVICHKCDVRSCCNPDHLFLGTYQDNSNDCIAKGRTAKGERGGNSHLTREQVLEIRRVHELEGLTYRQLAKMFGIGHTTARSIVLKHTWKIVEK